jgi:hypothetical protein
MKPNKQILRMQQLAGLITENEVKSLLKEENTIKKGDNKLLDKAMRLVFDWKILKLSPTLHPKKGNGSLDKQTYINYYTKFGQDPISEKQAEKEWKQILKIIGSGINYQHPRFDQFNVGFNSLGTSSPIYKLTNLMNIGILINTN